MVQLASARLLCLTVMEEQQFSLSFYGTRLQYKKGYAVLFAHTKAVRSGDAELANPSLETTSLLPK